MKKIKQFKDNLHLPSVLSREKNITLISKTRTSTIFEANGDCDCRDGTTIFQSSYLASNSVYSVEKPPILPILLRKRSVGLLSMSSCVLFPLPTLG